MCIRDRNAQVDDELGGNLVAHARHRLEDDRGLGLDHRDIGLLDELRIGVRNGNSSGLGVKTGGIVLLTRGDAIVPAVIDVATLLELDVYKRQP